MSDLKKKIDGEDVDDDDEDQRRDYTNYGRRPSQGFGTRRSGERDRYDADPQVLGDDFAGLELRDDESMILHVLTYLKWTLT